MPVEPPPTPWRFPPPWEADEHGLVATLDEESPFGALPRVALGRHEIGQPLDSLSLDELSERIDTLRDEILRLERVRSGKEATRQAADSFFKL